MKIIDKYSSYDTAPADPELFTTAVVQADKGWLISHSSSEGT